MRYRRRKTKKRILLKIVIVLVIIAGFTYWQYKSYINHPVDKNDTTNISFQVKEGTTAKTIAYDLKEEGLIKSKTAFYIYVKNNNKGESILAGRFLLTKSMNVKEIVEALADPTLAEEVITIQEGLRIRDIDEKLATLGLTNEGEFINAVKNFNGWEYYDFLDETTLKTLDLPLEGYIYPDTYFLDPTEFKAEDLIYLALDNFENKFKTANSDRNGKSINEIITMASIIENEVREEEDRAMVSGILWKRIESEWTLGADATLRYINGDKDITASDLKLDSQYNTRKNTGLPPGPISNPSISSIKAALNPKESEYWFYLSTSDTGETIYARSNEEHNINRAKYL
jgi:UPF0755 protein